MIVLLITATLLVGGNHLLFHIWIAGHPVEGGQAAERAMKQYFTSLMVVLAIEFTVLTLGVLLLRKRRT